MFPDAVLLGTPDDRATYIGMSEQPDLMGKTPAPFPGPPVSIRRGVLNRNLVALQ